MRKDSTLPVVMPTIRSVKRSNHSPWRVRAAVALGCAVLAAAALAVPTASAATSAASAAIKPGPWSAAGDSSLVKANVSLTGQLDIADADITHTVARADTTATPRSHADAHNTGVLSLLNQNVDLSTILSSATQDAPPQAAAADSHTLIPIPASPLVDAGISNASARALWAGDDQCVAADTPVAEGHEDIAHLNALASGGAIVLGVNNAQQGVSYTTNDVALPSNGLPNDGRNVVAASTIQLAGLDALTVPGMGPLVHIDAVGPYTATATATGIPGTASVNLDDPVVHGTIAGQDLATFMGGQNEVDLNISTILGQPINTTLKSLLQSLSPLLDPLAQIISIEVPTPTRTVNPDGTSASISGSLLEVRVLSALGAPPLASISLAPFSATATAPAGGLFCGPGGNPVTVTKASDKTTVQPGETFVYTITIGNTATDCTLTNVHASDVLTGPAGSTIDATDPQASSQTWPNVVWNPGTLPDIPPGGTIDLHVTVHVPVTAVPGDTFGDTATGFGTCNGTEFNTTFALNGIPSVVEGVLPRTGGDATWPLIGALMLLAGAFGLRRLRRA